jgi:hypothetical protein
VRAAIVASLFACSAPGQRGAVETGGTMPGFPAEWPAGPPAKDRPAWAVPGAIRFARWDGGRIETAKAFLSGWPGFNPPVPDLVESMTNWYTPRTIELLRAARFNAIWVTFSNGFSIPTERAHQEQLRTYIDLCHRAGIRVLAYESIANLFWEDMFDKAPESKDWVRMGADGKPTPYGAAAYAKMGRTTRYMARIGHPGWQEYLKRRVDLALDAGADGIFYDNNFNEALVETYQAIYRHAAARKRDVVLMGNFHQSSYALNRLTNAISTEDGLEPGVYAAANVTGRIERLRPTLLAAEGGYVINNVGLFRLQLGLSAGWKPVLIEHGHRETGDRFTNSISGPRHQLAIAEAAACGAGFQVFSEGMFADGLWRGEPAAMENWRAIGQYHRFLEENGGLYGGTKSAARLAIVVDDRSEGAALFNGLAARNVQFDVLYEHDLTAESLAGFRVAAVIGSTKVRPRARTVLDAFAARGGKAVEIKAGPVEEVAAALRGAEGAPRFRLDAPAGVVAVARQQGARLLVHLLNYTARPVDGVTLTTAGACGKAAVHSPDAARPVPLTGASAAGDCALAVGRLVRYSVVALERAAR